MILIKGLIPGPKGAIVVIKKVGENKKFVPLYKEIVEEEIQVQSEVIKSSGEHLSDVPVEKKVKELKKEVAVEAKAKLKEKKEEVV